MSSAHAAIPSEVIVHLWVCFATHFPGSHKFPTLPKTGIPGLYWESRRSKLSLLMMDVMPQEPVPVISIPETEHSKEGLLWIAAFIITAFIDLSILHLPYLCQALPSYGLPSFCHPYVIHTCAIFCDLALYLNAHLISPALELKYLGSYYTRNTPTSICLNRGLERKLEFFEQIWCLVGQEQILQT